MAVVYVDASAFVKLLIDEPGSVLAADLWDHADLLVASRLCYAEVGAALAAAHRGRRLTQRQWTESGAALADFWSAISPIELTQRIAVSATVLASRHGLRGADAVHLASALDLGVGNLTIAVWDRRLHQGAVDAGLSVAPRLLD